MNLLPGRSKGLVILIEHWGESISFFDIVLSSLTANFFCRKSVKFQYSLHYSQKFLRNKNATLINFSQSDLVNLDPVTICS